MTEEDSKQKAAMDGAKKRIRWLQNFLEAKCPAKEREIVSLWQYETGQAPRKTKEYLESIRAAGKIEFFEKNRERWLRLAGRGKPLEKRFNTETMQNEMMEEEEPPESFMQYAQKDKEKQRREINAVRRKLGLKPL
jgi:hypothetical protein